MTSTKTFTVTLSALNSYGEDTESKVEYIMVTQAPIAEFTVDSRQGKAPFVVKFRDTSMATRRNGTGNSAMERDHQNRTPPMYTRLKVPMMSGSLYQTSMVRTVSSRPEVHPSGGMQHPFR